MRVYGRTYDEYGVPTWQVVETQPNGSNDYVYVTALIQCIKLNLNESPFWADWGIPAQQSLVQQVAPDYYVALLQQRYAPYFARLTITKETGAANPTYNVSILTHSGTTIQATIPV